LFAKVIVNPEAGAGKTRRLWPQIKSLFQGHGLRFEHDITEAPGHAIELAAVAARNGYDMIVSVGGDGTVNEVVNGIHASGNMSNSLLGIVSTGTGSDYIRTVGLPRRYEEACKRFLRPEKRKVDVGIVEYMKNGSKAERLFVNFAGTGFDAEIVRRTTQQFKNLGGLLSYLCGTVATILMYGNKKISLKVDGEETEKKVCTVIMNNGKYGGGGMYTAPGADLADGLLDVLVVGDMSRPKLLYSLPRIYKGTHLTIKNVSMKKAKEIEIKSLGPKMHLQADGDLLGELPARFRILPSALNIIV
jgi:diacylglycerol kinase (ATP)